MWRPSRPSKPAQGLVKRKKPHPRDHRSGALKFSEVGPARAVIFFFWILRPSGQIASHPTHKKDNWADVRFPLALILLPPLALLALGGIFRWVVTGFMPS